MNKLRCYEFYRKVCTDSVSQAHSYTRIHGTTAFQMGFNVYVKRLDKADLICVKTMECTLMPQHPQPESSCEIAPTARVSRDLLLRMVEEAAANERKKNKCTARVTVYKSLSLFNFFSHALNRKQVVGKQHF